MEGSYEYENEPLHSIGHWWEILDELEGLSE
jgi:hypothetical protein